MGKKTGEYGEILSRKYLTDKDYNILANNYRTKIGEIDIIAQNKNLIVFIEVKTRRSTTFGLPREAVNYRKQRTLYKLAEQYIQYNKIKDTDFRFDVIEVRWEKDSYSINHIENAFGN